MLFFMSSFDFRTIVRKKKITFAVDSYRELKMKITRDYIISKAFELYLKDGYSDVSISDLQEYLNIGRATLYYYFSGKDELFKAVVDKYCIGIYSITDVASDVTLPDLIEIHIRHITKIMNWLLRSKDVQTTRSNLFSLVLNACLRFPEYKDITNDLREKSEAMWEQAILNSIERKEIRADVNVRVLAAMFANVKDLYGAALN